MCRSPFCRSLTQAITITAPARGGHHYSAPRITLERGAQCFRLRGAAGPRRRLHGRPPAPSNMPGLALHACCQELVPSTTYYVRVRALSACGAAPYSAVVSFTTGTQTCQHVRGTPTCPRPFQPAPRPSYVGYQRNRCQPRLEHPDPQPGHHPRRRERAGNFAHQPRRPARGAVRRACPGTGTPEPELR